MMAELITPQDWRDAPLSEIDRLVGDLYQDGDDMWLSRDDLIREVSQLVDDTAAERDALRAEVERLREAESGLREAVELLRRAVELEETGDVLDWDLWYLKAEELVERLGGEVSE